MIRLNDWHEFNAEPKNFGNIPVECFAGKGKWVDLFIETRTKDIKINQLRNFFGEIQSILNDPEKKKTEELRNTVSILEMNLAYDFGRNVITGEFYELITKSLEKIHTPEDFDKFVIFIKALIAYHKLHASANK